MSGSSKGPSLLSKIRGFIKPPWKVTGPTTNPDYLPSTPTALEYRVHSPGSPSRKAVIPHSSPDLVYNIQYYTRDPSHNRTMVYREFDPNAVRAKLNKEKLTEDDKVVLKELGFDYEKLRTTPDFPKCRSIMDYPNNGYE